MNARVMGKRVRSALRECEDGWRKAGCRSGREALRWWIAHRESQDALSSRDEQEWREMFRDGIESLPKRMKELMERVYDACDGDEDTLEAYLAYMKHFYWADYTNRGIPR